MKMMNETENTGQLSMLTVAECYSNSHKPIDRDQSKVTPHKMPDSILCGKRNPANITEDIAGLNAIDGAIAYNGLAFANYLVYTRA